MTSRLRRALPTFMGYLDERVVRWRTGTTEGQVAVASALGTLTVAIFAGSEINYNIVPVATFVLPMLLATLLLRYRPMLAVLGLVLLAVAVTILRQGVTSVRISTFVVMLLSATIILYESSRHRSGLPGPVGEAMLVDLRDRLQSQGVVPPLPEGWRSQSAMSASGGLKFAGDFLVANLSDDRRHLEMVLVDVCGKGVAAGTQSLQLAGALGGLIGALPPLGLFAAANDFLLRQSWDEGFATAVHVLVDLETGEYSIISAGHPPALRWDADAQDWEVDGARGTALGILRRPDFHSTRGVLDPGDALMFYTDGVIESRSQDVVTGIAWLQHTARSVVLAGFDQAPRRIIAKVKGKDDDRAVLILSRAAVAAELTTHGDVPPVPAGPTA